MLYVRKLDRSKVIRLSYKSDLRDRRLIGGVSGGLRRRPNTVYTFLIYTGILYVKDLVYKFDFF